MGASTLGALAPPTAANDVSPDNDMSIRHGFEMSTHLPDGTCAARSAIGSGSTPNLTESPWPGFHLNLVIPGSQQLLDHVPRPVDSRLHRPQRELQRLGDLLIG